MPVQPVKSAADSGAVTAAQLLAVVAVPTAGVRVERVIIRYIGAIAATAAAETDNRV